jgi:phosphoglycolate phosphatase-like HAD superfamily hydrolase
MGATTMDEIQALADANNGYRAARILQLIERSEAHQRVEDDARPLVRWLSDQLIASRRGAESIALAESAPEKIGPDHREDVHTTFSDQNNLYLKFREYSGAQGAVMHAEWVDGVVDALEHLEKDGWDALADQQKQAIHDKVEPFLRTLLEASDRELTSSGSLLAT